MKTFTLIALIAGAALVAGPATGGASKVSKKEAEAAMRPVGAPESCLHLSQIRESRVRDDRTIDFYTVGGQVYRNVLPHSCPSLGFERAFSYATSLSQLCSTDIITVLHTGGGPQRGASCGLGQFQKVEGAPR